MTVHHTRERDPDAVPDSDSETPLDDARRATLIDRLKAVDEPSSSVDHLLEYLAGARTATTMTVVDWTLPLSRTDGGTALRVVRSDGAVAYFGFVDDEFRATPWRTDSADAAADPPDSAAVAPREWFPDDPRVDPLPVEASPFDG